jgi:hypothetical protein
MQINTLNPERDFKRQGFAIGYDASEFDEDGKLIANLDGDKVFSDL